jgi:hypothetical protein
MIESTLKSIVVADLFLSNPVTCFEIILSAFSSESHTALKPPKTTSYSSPDLKPLPSLAVYKIASF